MGSCVADRISGRLVGHVTLFGAKLLTRSATLTVMIGSEHTGSGYGTDAVRTLIEEGVLRETVFHDEVVMSILARDRSAAGS